MTLTSLRNSSLAKNTGWMLVGQLGSLGVQAAYFLILARLLGSVQYGTFVGVTSLIAIIGNFSSLGSGMVLLRYVSSNLRKLPEYWGNAILSTLLAGSASLVLAVCLGSHLLGKQNLSILILVAAGDCICSKITECAGQAFQAAERLRGTAALNSLISTTRLLVAFALFAALRHASAVQWAWASLGVSLIALVVSVSIVTLKLGAPRFRPALLRKTLQEGFGFSIAYSTTSIYNDVDKTMLAHYRMYAENGAYSVAYRMLDMACVPIRSLHAAALPRYFRLGPDGIQATSGLARSILKKTLPYGILASILLFLCAPVAPLLLGPGFARATPALRWLCLIPIMRSLHLSAGDAITAAGYQRLRTSSQFGAAALNFVLNLFVIPLYSWKGAASTSVLTDGALALCNWAIVFHLLTSQSRKNNDNKPFEKSLSQHSGQHALFRTRSGRSSTNAAR